MLIRRCIAALIGTFLLGPCTASPEPEPVGPQPANAPVAAMTVYRSPDCSCCHLWADIAREDGWSITTVDKLDMAAFKADAGIPPEYSSCHTAIVGDYFVEGHVPLEAVEKLLAEKPEIDGIALPGMPAGSPGMGGIQEAPFEVVAISDGVATAFGSY